MTVGGKSLRSPPTSPNGLREAESSSMTAAELRKREDEIVKRRIESTTSRTAEWVCMSRAMSSLETESCYKSDDHIALLLLPAVIRLLISIPPIRRFFVKKMPAKGIYEYVIARTKYIDGVFREALAQGFDQILIFGAGFDTRAVRFSNDAAKAKIFELDVPSTQNAKIGQYRKRNLRLPSNLCFVPINFDKESLPDKLESAGFQKEKRSLFILEGLLMYLQSESVDQTFRVIQSFAGKESEIVFDFVYASVLRGEDLYQDERGISETVARAGEKWSFGIEKGAVEDFLARYNMKPLDQKDAPGLEAMYFPECRARGARSKSASGTAGLVNGTHCLVRAKTE